MYNRVLVGRAYLCRQKKSMKNLSLKQWSIVAVLALLTALEPLSIDLYLPGFFVMAESFKTDIAQIQLSLSTFLGGFAVGQLLWGPVADRFGRKKPILLSLVLFMAATIACIYTRTAEQLWVFRFIQAIGGCGGIVISRAVVTDFFGQDQRLRIFSLLAVIMGVAPIVAPLIGNAVLDISGRWQGLFGALALMGAVLFLLTAFFLPETRRKELMAATGGAGSIIRGYAGVIRIRQFLIYSLVAGFVNGALMIYISNGPFLIMEAAGFSGVGFSLAFGLNAFGLILGSYFANILTRRYSPEKLCKSALFLMAVISIAMTVAMYFDGLMHVVLVILFFYLFVTGILFPVTTELVLKPFTHNSGTASSLFGTLQMSVAFICSLVSGVLNDGTVVTIGLEILLCAVIAFICLFGKISQRQVN